MKTKKESLQHNHSMNAHKYSPQNDDIDIGRWSNSLEFQRDRRFCYCCFTRKPLYLQHCLPAIPQWNTGQINTRERKKLIHSHQWNFISLAVRAIWLIWIIWAHLKCVSSIRHFFVQCWQIYRRVLGNYIWHCMYVPKSDYIDSIPPKPSVWLESIRLPQRSIKIIQTIKTRYTQLHHFNI